MESWTIVYTALFPQNIYLPQSLLESEGIKTFVKDELTAQIQNFYSNAIGGVKLMVPTEEAARAHTILVDGGYIEK